MLLKKYIVEQKYELISGFCCQNRLGYLDEYSDKTCEEIPSKLYIIIRINERKKEKNNFLTE